MTIEFANARTLVTGNCEVLAEAGQCMEGDPDRAVTMVRDAAKAGAWGLKVQLLNPLTIATPDAEKYWDDDLDTRTQREAFTAAGLIDYDRWGPVREVARQTGLAFVATPFDLEAVKACEALEVDAYKVASGDLLWTPLLDAILETGRPFFVSVGAAWADEIVETLEYCCHKDRRVRERLVLLACSLVYPTPTNDANVGRIPRLRELLTEYGWRSTLIGYSDHTTIPETARYAAAAGAVLLEKHYTYRGASGPVADHGMAVDPEGLAETVVEAQRGAQAYGDDRLAPTRAEERARLGARRGMYYVRDVRLGDEALPTDAVALRPCPSNGLPPIAFYRETSNRAVWRYDRSAGDLVGQNDLVTF